MSKKETIITDKSKNRMRMNDLANSIVRATTNCIRGDHTNNTGALSNVELQRVLTKSHERMLVEYPVLDREELVEKMTDAIEDRLHDLEEDVMRDHAHEGDVDSDMAREALKDAVDRRGW